MDSAIVIYPVDSVIHRFNNWGLVFNSFVIGHPWHFQPTIITSSESTRYVTKPTLSSLLQYWQCKDLRGIKIWGQFLTKLSRVTGHFAYCLLAIRLRTRGLFAYFLRTVPTIVIVHTFCASLDTRISYRQCLLIQGYFCAVWNCPEKVDLGKYSCYPKRKLGVTMHFWEIIKLQFEKERHTLLCILKLFTDIILEIIIFEKCVVTRNFLFGFQ